MLLWNNNQAIKNTVFLYMLLQNNNQGGFQWKKKKGTKN